ncbi:MAG: sigma-E factor negative regulatory protein [Methylophaga sp.]|nr:sigma-E factor negative regulatory protein [Methylophaga sp.]
MTINQNELLSALVDGELQSAELDQVLQVLATDELATAQFQRYQQTKDVLKGYGERGLSHNLANRISVAVENEAVYSQQATQHKAEVIALPTPFWKQMTGLAVAASVGALAVVGVMTQPQNDLLTNTSMAAIDAPTEVITVAQTGTRWTVNEPEIENRLNSYLLDHNEQTGTSGVFSYARVVSYGAE